MFSAPSQSPPAASEESTAPREGAQQRDPYFDNAKFLAIVLVAVGHSWEPLRDGSRVVMGLYMFVYAFHMPAFTVISGYFSQSFAGRPGQLKRLVTGVAVPYVLFMVGYTGFQRVTGGNPDQAFTLLNPWWLLWFLMALLVWRLTAPVWKLLRWPVALALAIAVFAAVSPELGNDLDIQRVLQFLPYFVTGLVLKPHHFSYVRTARARWAALPVAGCALVLAYWAAAHMNDEWFYHDDSAQELGAPWWAGVVMTLAMFGCSLLLTGCFLAWVPGRQMWFSGLGTRTMYGFLLHGFVIKGADAWGWYGAPWLHTPLGEVAVTLLAAGLITLLCTAPVQRAFRFAVEPRMRWAFSG